MTPLKPTEFQITWKEPKFPHGQILNYNLLVTRIGPKYKIPDHCQIRLPEKNSTTISVGLKLSHVYMDAEPYTEYYIQLASENSIGIGEFSTPIGIVTQPSSRFDFFNVDN